MWILLDPMGLAGSGEYQCCSSQQKLRKTQAVPVIFAQQQHGTLAQMLETLLSAGLPNQVSQGRQAAVRKR